jgi:hypothetical protein
MTTSDTATAEAPGAPAPADIPDELGASFVGERLIREIRADGRWPTVLELFQPPASYAAAGTAARLRAELDKFDRQVEARVDGCIAEHHAHADQEAAVAHGGRPLPATTARAAAPAVADPLAPLPIRGTAQPSEPLSPSPAPPADPAPGGVGDATADPAGDTAGS